MSQSIDQLLALLSALPDAEMAPPGGVPHVGAPHILPMDLERFFQVCGGVRLFPRSDYPIRVVGPTELRRTNDVLWGHLPSEATKEVSADRSWSWFTIAADEKGDYLSIDLSPERLGRCYDSFWDRHAVPGESRVVATSFTDLVLRLIENRGDYWYWLREEFVSLGDAYD